MLENRRNKFMANKKENISNWKINSNDDDDDDDYNVFLITNNHQ